MEAIIKALAAIRHPEAQRIVKTWREKKWMDGSDIQIAVKLIKEATQRKNEAKQKLQTQVEARALARDADEQLEKAKAAADRVRKAQDRFKR